MENTKNVNVTNENITNDNQEIEKKKIWNCGFIEKVKALIDKAGSERVLKASISGGLIVFALVVCLLNCSFGYVVKVGEEKLGLISSKEILSDAMSDIDEEVFSLTGKSFRLKNEPKISYGIALKSNLVDYDELTAKLKSVSEMMIPAHTIVVDGKAILALPSEEMAMDALDEYKNTFYTGETGENAEFANKVEIIYTFAPKDILCTKDSAVSFLTEGEYSYYRAEAEESVSLVAERTGVSEEAIIRENSILCETIRAGQVLKIYSGRMFADVVAVERVQREEAIPFETVAKESDEIYIGATKIETNGVDGVRYIDERLTYINGVITKRDVYSDKIIKEPVTQIELLGTKELPPSVGTGNLAMPTGGSLSSRFGSRWGRQHSGIDLSAPEGTPIYAADNGTVIYSQFNDGGYGYLIRIDHGNGIETFYAHCSELLVEKDQIVAKGDLIAKVGNTGRSTGAHLHFEVRENGNAIDPLPYLNE